MIFNSIDFAIFLPIIFALYWLIGRTRIKTQNALIVLSSYFFYGCWDWRFLGLILFSTIVDYTIGIKLGNTNKSGHKRILLWISIITNLGLLGYFKYANFFLENFVEVFTFFGYTIESSYSLKIILPVGISFYTFQTLSYTIDVYREKLNPTRNFIAFTAFVSFFPQLVAGPIERATNLLPQFLNNRKFSYSLAIDGLRQILWGLFKKVVIADNCAELVNIIYDGGTIYSGSTIFLGSVFFAFQIYGDFSGYSDIAIGISRLFGFDLKQNFSFPYFSRDIAEFWRRWHISLSTWFRDYLYIPLGGSSGSYILKIRNIFIIFIVSGFWHGANWTFVVWGLLNAIYFLPLMLSGRNRRNIQSVAESKKMPTIRDSIAILSTFILTVFAWIFFRATNLEQAFDFMNEIFSKSLLTIPEIRSTKLVLFILIFVLIEWVGRRDKYAIEKIGENWKPYLRWCFYYTIIFCIIFFSGKQQEFIYFQF